MAEAILARRPKASTEIVDFWVLVAFGSATAAEKRLGVTPRMQDRLAAAAELADRLHGRELIFEAQEPGNDEVPIAEVLAKFPAGEYRFQGHGVEGETMEAVAKLTHAIPATPRIEFPADGATVYPANFAVAWQAVTQTRDGAPVEIAGYQLIVEKDVVPPTPPRGFAKSLLSVHIPPATTSVTVPKEFLERNTPYKFEVLALEAGGNQTIASSVFRTQP